MIALVRAKREHINTLADAGRVGYGWSDADLTGANSGDECMERICNLDYVNLSSRQHGRIRGQLHILSQLREGHHVVVPTWGGVYIAKVVADGITYDKTFYNDPANPEKVIDQANTIQVEFFRNSDGSLKYFHRDSFYEGLQTSLKFRGSVKNLSNYKEEIEHAISGKSIAERHDENLQKQEKEFKAELLNRLHNGKTFLKSGGRGLEELVMELMQLQGYTASIFDKKRFAGMGDADVLAEKCDPILGEIKLLIQVKHHRHISGEHMLKQLEAIQENESGLWGEHKMVAITTGAVQEHYKEQYVNEVSSIISILDGESFVDLIYEYLDQLSSETRKLLGVSFQPIFTDKR